MAAAAPVAGPPDKRRLIGTVVAGVYKVKSMLGQGGMASVYQAEQQPMGRDVALKVLALDRSIGDEPWKRFLLEARAAASLSHPNICQVFDFGELEDKSPFYTMERLIGEPLSERIARENALGFIDVVDILMQVLAGLAAAHKKNIIHRDIKPENVFLVLRDGRPPLVKLLDFGVSKIMTPDDDGGDDITQITRTGIVMGTPFYMAPEQAYGGRDFDARVDLWSTGIIFFEAIVGRRPFTSNTYAGLLNAIIREPHRQVRELRPGTPVEVQMVIDKALSKAREDRYQSATEFMGDLQRLRERLMKMGLGPGSTPRLPVVAPATPGEDEGTR